MPKKKKMGVVEQREAFLVGAKFINRAVKTYCTDQILGIDPSVTSTGFALKTLSGKVWLGKMASSSYGFSRLIKIEKMLKKILKSISPLVVIEGYAHNATYGREVAGELGGVIRRTLWYNKRPFLTVSPLTLKSWVKAGKKENIMLEILDKYGIKIPNSDMADAFVLQEIGAKAALMAEDVIHAKLRTAEHVRLYFKHEGYKKGFYSKQFKDLFKYQARSLFNLFISQGPKVEFFLKALPSLENSV